jgi:hypothetical protein
MAMMNPYLIIGALVGAIALFGGGFAGGVRYEAGIAAKRDLARERAQSEAVLAVVAENEAIQKANEAKARKVSRSHADELATIRAQFNADRAGGLRVTSAVCDAVTFKADSPGAGRVDAPAAGTVQLPAEIERRLRELARDADEVTATARALQDWARANGFYGPPEK